jgi:hypothetical protein
MNILKNYNINLFFSKHKHLLMLMRTYLSSQINNYKQEYHYYDGLNNVSPHPPLNLCFLVLLRCILFL